MLTAGTDIFKLLSNSHRLTKVIWLPLEVVMPQVCQLGGRQRCNINFFFFKSSFEQCEDVVQNKKEEFRIWTGMRRLLGTTGRASNWQDFPINQGGEKSPPWWWRESTPGYVHWVCSRKQTRLLLAYQSTLYIFNNEPCWCRITAPFTPCINQDHVQFHGGSK